MTGFFWRIARPLLFTMAPERAHALALMALKTGVVPGWQKDDTRLRCSVAGIDFPNPLGMAAGFDKNAEMPDAVLKLGFGFTEIGTVTPVPQPGNPRPRLFRLRREQAIINRMGFNNEGHEAVCRRLSARRKRGGIVGVNIGANKDSGDRIADYVKGIARFYEVCDYFTVNISSPNTPGLRNLQARAALRPLLGVVAAMRDQQNKKTGQLRPVFVKIAPDLTEKELDDIAAELVSHQLDGLIISNTTLSRSGIKAGALRQQGGGLSGRPLFQRSTVILAKMRKRLGPHYPIIGVGGVFDGETALEKIRAGADLIQLYTSLVYQGPGVARNILESLSAACRRDGVKTVACYRDQNLEQWAGRTIGP